MQLLIICIPAVQCALWGLIRDITQTFLLEQNYHCDVFFTHPHWQDEFDSLIRHVLHLPNQARGNETSSTDQLGSAGPIFFRGKIHCQYESKLISTSLQVLCISVILTMFWASFAGHFAEAIKWPLCRFLFGSRTDSFSFNKGSSSLSYECLRWAALQEFSPISGNAN